MGELRSLCATEQDDFVKKLVVLSELNLFKDVCPGYKIRTHEDSEDVALSKEVLQLRAFEEGLLKHYQAFLAYLEEVVKSKFFFFEKRN